MDFLCKTHGLVIGLKIINYNRLKFGRKMDELFDDFEKLKCI